MEARNYIPRKPNIIAVFYDTLTGEYLCSKHPFDTPEEAIQDQNPEEGAERYDLVETIILKTV